jgi:hypothetical protein
MRSGSNDTDALASDGYPATGGFPTWYWHPALQDTCPRAIKNAIDDAGAIINGIEFSQSIQ